MSEVRSGKAGYHHGDLRNALVDAASELARGGGPEAVVLREAARRVGVSPTAAYRHFASQADLLQAVKDEGQRRLADSMDKVIAETEGPPGGDPADAAKGRLMALGLGYVRFAVTEPGMYRAAFCRVEQDRQPWNQGEGIGDLHPGDVRSFRLLIGAMDALDAAGVMRPGVRTGAEFAAWSSVHGLAMLLLDGPLGGLPPPQRDAIVTRTLTMILDGLTV
ncbi:TetR/AcrR family transcriptional regulator [Streptomyces sp. CMB-StM0423]|uniref:TetR/AcrR family transcriptional regulator n=1 Tax=Streptomyces sp. CMB-StM0423 TaxID=2059884 RepID=UPI000C70A7EF|nr:TetR/AcrR family transcriptional regulator [Streptomyces sp. CMB-StM0423]AUH39194.1 TetR/AcrR family transcriptional regulator [Streptomyces sp. CMB-StM0423]